MPHNDNPVGRLFLILDAVWKLPPKTRFDQGLRTALRVDEVEEHIVLKRMAAVFRLPAQARQDVTT